ncbi:hypothetical protein BU202_04260 [Streptococcus cuniculi]|uniref:Uncharacterized protein n=1 Tax=Streptococcus cuniculi TaxID=1432788 RepID=A0A1Q8E8U5_9STRE|nr:hypothetical protein BU202_04260 [Streptococcus cuniculi]
MGKYLSEIKHIIAVVSVSIVIKWLLHAYISRFGLKFYFSNYIGKNVNEVSLNRYFLCGGILSDSEVVAKNGIFEILGSKMSNETPKEVLRSHYQENIKKRKW